MNRKQLFDEINNLQEIEKRLIEVKNNDYGAEDAPFANFEMFGELGFLVRMSDKLMRAKQIISKGDIKVKDETLRDTLMDLSNYANLLIVYLEVNNAKSK